MILDQPLAAAAINDKGLFIGEIEAALRDGRIDLAVHSAKDLPSTLPPDLTIAAWTTRADPRDALVSRAGDLRALPPGARVGTSSPRRACQLRALRPDLEVRDIRGNVDTRLRKLAAATTTPSSSPPPVSTASAWPHRDRALRPDGDAPGRRPGRARGRDPRRRRHDRPPAGPAR